MSEGESKLVLYGRINSGNVQKILWLLDELQVSYKRIDAGGKFDMNGNNKEFLKLNPNGLVPVIVDDDFVLYESNAILRYISSKYGGAAFYPFDFQQRAVIEQWLDWYFTIVANTRLVYMQLIRTPKEKQDTKIIHSSVEQGNHDWQQLDGPIILWKVV
eukprot:TRINITY_DN12837_c0_g1_i1.p1 TRINITY_DN12837_c0_g1~~TRINITY_DN12837_c0_g1_i1.p1  ORF type:complete len:159 (-),score=34.34 TRINITY_DN12837_c0_g1_i1:72-548(-)